MEPSSPPPAANVPTGRPPPPKVARPPPPRPPTKRAATAPKDGNCIGKRYRTPILKGRFFKNEFLLSDEMLSFMDVDLMKRVFAKGDKGATGRTGSIMLDTKRKILGSRAQNIAIVLSRLSLPVEDIAIKLNEMTPEGISREVLEKVMEISPTDDEMKQYEEFVNDKEPLEALRDVDKKYFPFFKVLRMREKCRVLLSAIRIPEMKTDLKVMLDVLYRGGSEVRKSQRFRAFLIAVLLWGNFVNHGVQEEDQLLKDNFGRRRHRAGTAGLEIRTFGFTLPSLLKLAEFKTTVDPSISSLHFIIANMIMSQPKVELDIMLEEMPSISEASKIPASALKEGLANMKEVNFLSSELKSKDAAVNYGEAAVERIKILFDESKETHADINNYYQSVTSFVGETAAYFGDQKAKTRSESHEEFFKTLDIFLQKFQVCVRDYKRNTKKFKDILMESAQNRGLTYVKYDDALGGPVESDAKLLTGVPKKLIGGKTKSKGTPYPRSAGIEESSTMLPVQADESVVCLSNAPRFKRSMKRRASAIGISQQAVIAAPTARLAQPTSSIEREASTAQFKRSIMRTATSAGALYGLGPHQALSQAGPVLPPRISKEEERMRAFSSKFRMQAEHPTQKDSNIVDTKTVEQAYNRLMPKPEEIVPVSDTEINARKTRNYVVFASNDQIESEPEDNTRRSMSCKFSKKSCELVESEHHVCNGIRSLIHGLSEERLSLPADFDESLENALYYMDVEAALDDGIKEFIRLEKKGSFE